MPCELVSSESPLSLSWVLQEEFGFDSPEVEKPGSRISAKELGCTKPVQPGFIHTEGQTLLPVALLLLEVRAMLS